MLLDQIGKSKAGRVREKPRPSGAGFAHEANISMSAFSLHHLQEEYLPVFVVNAINFRQ